MKTNHDIPAHAPSAASSPANDRDGGGDYIMAKTLAFARWLKGPGYWKFYVPIHVAGWVCFALSVALVLFR